MNKEWEAERLAATKRWNEAEDAYREASRSYAEQMDALCTLWAEVRRLKKECADARAYLLTNYSQSK